MSEITITTTSKITTSDEVFTIIDDISEMFLTSRKLKAVTMAFSETFTENAAGADIEEIRARPEHFLYLFDTMRDLVIEMYDQATKADADTTAYVESMRQQHKTA